MIAPDRARRARLARLRVLQVVLQRAAERAPTPGRDRAVHEPVRAAQAPEMAAAPVRAHAPAPREPRPAAGARR